MTDTVLVALPDDLVDVPELSGKQTSQRLNTHIVDWAQTICTLTGQSTPLPKDPSRELSTVEFSLPRSANEFITGYFGLMLSPDEVPVTRRFTHGTR